MLKRFFVLLAHVSVCASPAVVQADGAEIFNTVCAQCHQSPVVLNAAQQSAPPVFAVRNHYLQAYPNKNDFIAAIVSWVKQPAAEKSQMPGALRRFGLMPAQSLSDEKLHEVAEYLYASEFKPPRAYGAHYRQHHGRMPVQTQ